MSEKHGVLTTGNGLVVRQNIEYEYRKPSETAVFHAEIRARVAGFGRIWYNRRGPASDAEPQLYTAEILSAVPRHY